MKNKSMGTEMVLDNADIIGDVHDFDDPALHAAMGYPSSIAATHFFLTRQKRLVSNSQPGPTSMTDFRLNKCCSNFVYESNHNTLPNRPWAIRKTRTSTQNVYIGR
jgi:hypothetical protein